MQYGNQLPAPLVANLTSALSDLTNGIQSGLSSGLTLNFYAPYVRISTFSLSSRAINGVKFLPAASGIESLIGAKLPFITINTQNLDDNNIFQVTLVQFNINPHNHNTTSISLSASVKSSIAASYTQSIHLFNLETVNYHPNTTRTNGTVVCEKSKNQLPYNVSVTCHHTQKFYITCDGVSKNAHAYKCPALAYQPTCTIWNNNNYDTTPVCHVSEHSSTNTTCSCFFAGFDYKSTNANAKTNIKTLAYHQSHQDRHILNNNNNNINNLLLTQLSSLEIATFGSTYGTTSNILNGTLNEFATSLVQTNAQLTYSTTYPIPSLTPESVAKNWVILTVMGIFTFLLFIGLFLFIITDIRESELITKPKIMEKFDTMIENSIPIEYNRNLRWTQRFWSKMTTDHDLISVFAKYNADGDYRAAKWLMLFVFIFNFLFIDTII